MADIRICENGSNQECFYQNWALIIESIRIKVPLNFVHLRTFDKIYKAAIMFGQHYCHDRDGDSALKLHHQKLPVSGNR